MNRITHVLLPAAVLAFAFSGTAQADRYTVLFGSPELFIGHSSSGHKYYGHSGPKYYGHGGYYKHYYHKPYRFKHRYHGHWRKHPYSYRDYPRYRHGPRYGSYRPWHRQQWRHHGYKHHRHGHRRHGWRD